MGDISAVIFTVVAIGMYADVLFGLLILNERVLVVLVLRGIRLTVILGSGKLILTQTVATYGCKLTIIYGKNSKSIALSHDYKRRTSASLEQLKTS